MPKQAPAIRSIEELRSRCVMDDISGCWIWRGATDRGRPCIWSAQSREKHGAGYTICWLLTGKTPEGRTLWHSTCGTAMCANPEHFVKGNRSTLMKSVRPKLDPLHRAKIAAAHQSRSRFTPEVVAEVLASQEPDAVLCERYQTDTKMLWVLRNKRARLQVPNSIFNFRP